MARTGDETARVADGSNELSQELVRRIQEGDRDAWQRLYLRYRDPLLFAIRCRLGPKLRTCLQSEDILQSVVEDALRDLARFEHRGPGSLEHYLHVCVLNKIRSKAEFHGAAGRAGEERLSTTALDELGASAAAPSYLDGERYERLELGLTRLPESWREIVLLRSVEGLSNAQAAQILSMTPAAASKLYNRALARLGSALTGTG